jgi:hypothetical protein
MTIIKSIEEITVFESPDGGKTVYSRKMGEPHNSRTLHSVDPVWQKEQEIKLRWANLKEAVYMADSNPTLNDAISKVETLYVLLKKEEN